MYTEASDIERDNRTYEPHTTYLDLEHWPINHSPFHDLLLHLHRHLGKGFLGRSMGWLDGVEVK